MTIRQQGLLRGNHSTRSDLFYCLVCYNVNIVVGQDPLPGRNFTFWEWFFGILDLVRRHLLGPWQDG